LLVAKFIGMQRDIFTAEMRGFRRAAMALL